jgi:hypothetical protein
MLLLLLQHSLTLLLGLLQRTLLHMRMLLA